MPGGRLLLSSIAAPFARLFAFAALLSAAPPHAAAIIAPKIKTKTYLIIISSLDEPALNNNSLGYAGVNRKAANIRPMTKLKKA